MEYLLLFLISLALASYVPAIIFWQGNPSKTLRAFGRWVVSDHNLRPGPIASHWLR